MAGGIYITTVYGFKISYDSGVRQFILKDADEQEIGRGESQEEVEIAAQKLSKTNWDRWQVIVNARAVSITSFNVLTHDGWAVDDESGHKEQINLKWHHVYGRTLVNNQRLTQLTKLRADLDKMHREISALERGFTDELLAPDFETHAKESKTPPKRVKGE